MLFLVGVVSAGVAWDAAQSAALEGRRPDDGRSCDRFQFLTQLPAHGPQFLGHPGDSLSVVSYLLVPFSGTGGCDDSGKPGSPGSARAVAG